MYDHIRIVCPKCGQSASVPAHAIGHSRQCLRCGERFTAAPAQASGTITFKCACGRQFIVPVHHAGKTGQCPDCKQPVVVPSPSAPVTTSAAPQIEEDGTDEIPDEQPSRKPLIIGAAAVLVAVIVVGAFWLGRASGPQQAPQASPTAQRTESPRPKPEATKETAVEKPATVTREPDSKPAAVLTASAPAPAQPSAPPQEAAVSPAEPEPVASAAEPPATESSAPPTPNGPIGVVRQLESPGSTFTDIALSRDGRLLATASSRPFPEIIIWEMPSGEIIQRFRTEVGINALAFTADAAYVALAEQPGSVAFWNRSTQVITRSTRVHQSGTSSIYCAPTGLDAFTCGYSSNLGFWRVPNMQPLATPHVNGPSGFGMAISPDGKRLLFGGSSGLFQLWDIPTRQLVRSLHHPDQSVRAFAFSPDGRRALTGGGTSKRVDGNPVSDGEMSLVLWDLQTGQELRRFPGHRDPICTAAFTPDGHRAITGCGAYGYLKPNPAGADNNVRLWDLDSGKELARFDCGAAVRSLALSPDGRTAMCIGPEGILWVLSLDGNEAADATLASAEIPDLLTISKRLTGELNTLMTAGKYDEATRVIDASELDLRRFAGSVRLRLWDNSIAPLFRLAESKRGQIARKRGKEPGTQPADTDVQYAVRLSPAQLKGLANLRTALTRAGTLIQDNNTSQARTIVYKVKGELVTFVQISRVPEWHLAVAPLFQTVARLETAIDGKRDEKPTQAAAPAPSAPVQSSSSSRYLPVGQPAPAFTGMTLEGRAFSLTQLKGKWILLDFWSTGCGPCKTEMSTNLKDVYDTYGTDKRFAMLSVSIDNQVEDPANYIRQSGYKWGQVWVGGSWSSPALKAYNVNAIPAIFLISPDGRIAASGIRGANIKTAVATALSKK